MITSLLLLLIGLEWLRRALWMRNFRTSNPPLKPVSQMNSPCPKVSVLVPARNEEKNIGNCMKYLTVQNYPNYEIVCVNDRSSDKTEEIIKEYQKNSSIPIRLVTIQKLPEGWTGKNYAMFTGSKAVSGDWILFTDADTTHKPESISTSMTCALDQKIDLLTLAPETESRTFWENVVQPLAVSSLALWFRSHEVNDPKNKITLSNGQFILIKRSVYENSGGNESVKTQVVEDVEFTKHVKSLGYTAKFLNGTLIYSTRMYSSLKEIGNGWKRIFTYLFEKNLVSIFHKIFLFLFFSIFPFGILFYETLVYFLNSAYFSENLFLYSLLVCVLITVIRAVGNKMIRVKPIYAVYHLLGSIMMVWILAGCAGRVLFKQPSAWRGDIYK